jgi:hypothetical protein
MDQLSIPGIKIWLAMVVVWWAFSLVYHVVWIWRCRDSVCWAMRRLMAAILS